MRETVKTAIENGQNLVVEGCYIPFDWQTGFDEDYLPQTRYICLVMSEEYIKSHFSEIKQYASVIEQRLGDSDCTMESVLRDNAENPAMCRKYGADYLLIHEGYRVNLEL